MHTNSSASLSVVVAEQFLDQLVKPLVRMLSTLDVLQTHATLFSPKRHSCQDGKAPVTAVNSSIKEDDVLYVNTHTVTFTHTQT